MLCVFSLSPVLMRCLLSSQLSCSPHAAGRLRPHPSSSRPHLCRLIRCSAADVLCVNDVFSSEHTSVSCVHELITRPVRHHVTSSRLCSGYYHARRNDLFQTVSGTLTVCQTVSRASLIVGGWKTERDLRFEMN